MLDTRGDPIRLLLDGGEDSLLLGRNALARGRVHTTLEFGDAQHLGGKKLRLEDLGNLNFYLWETGVLPDQPELGSFVQANTMSLPKGVHGSTFTGAHVIVRQAAYSTAEWYSNRSARFGKDISFAIKSADDDFLFPDPATRNLTTVYRAKNKAKSQAPTPVYSSHVPVLTPFLYSDRFAVIDNGYNTPGNHLFVYDYQGNALSAGPLTWTPPASLWRTTLTQGIQGRFYVLFTTTDVFGHMAAITVQARHIDAPNTILWTQTLAIDPVWPANRAPSKEFPLDVYEWDTYTAIGYRKYYLRNLGVNSDGDYRYDWFILDRATGTLVTTWADTSIAQFSIEGTQAWVRRSESVVYTLDGQGRTTAATLVWGLDRYTPKQVNGLPTLQWVKALTTPGLTVTYNGTDLGTAITDTSHRLIPAYLS